MDTTESQCHIHLVNETNQRLTNVGRLMSKGSKKFNSKNQMYYQLSNIYL